MNKLRLSIVLIALMVSSIVLFSAVHFGTAQSGTNVNGIITSNTAWTQANSPYNLVGNLLVNNGVTLTIQAGTVVNLGSYYIEVNGTLQSVGNSANPITFNGGQITITQYSTNWTESTGAGCTIQNAFLTSTTMQIQASPLISNSTFTNSEIEVSCGNNMVAPLIYNNVFYNSGIGVGGYLSLYGWTQPIISNNTFDGQGISLGDISPQGNISALILNNVISGASTGINFGSSGGAGTQIAQGNIITGNTNGIIINEGYTYIQQITPIILNNTVTNNTIGIYVTYFFNSTISYNNIYNNLDYNIKSAVSNSINATYNWWGTTNTQAISQTIYDYYDNFNYGIVTYSPSLTAPNAEAPTYITASAGTGGSINPSGVVSVNYGGSQTFNITPNTGYYIVAVSVNGTSVGAVSTYTVQNIDGATTISATFAPNPTPTPSPSPSPTPTALPTATPTQTASPTSSPSPTATVPEFPALVIVPISLVAVSLAIVVTLRKRSKANA